MGCSSESAWLFTETSLRKMPVMKTEAVTAYCTSCRRRTRFVPVRHNHLKHLLWTVFTGGLWLIGWAICLLGGALRPLRCAECGWHNPEFRLPLDAAGSNPPTGRSPKPE